MNTLLAFFHQHYGRAYSFLYKDWADFQAQTFDAAGTVITHGLAAYKTGDPAGSYRLLKRYISGSLDRTRWINWPKADTLFTYPAGDPITDLTVDPDSGVTLLNSALPGGATEWVGEFYVRCRFDSDSLPMEARDRSAADLVLTTAITVTEDRD